MSDTLLDRFLRYVQTDTQSDETGTTAPSTRKQLVLSRQLAEECRQLGCEPVHVSDEGVVIATVPATDGCKAPSIAWLAHVDTSPETSGTDVQPIIHCDYDGRDLILPGDTSKVLRVEENPALEELTGKTIITTDGTTLLGADDKAGIAVIMTAAASLLSDSDLMHGPIQLCFTCDEEIGRGTVGLDLGKLNSVCGYTLDGEGVGKIDAETFSADLAVITVEGINTHPSIGYGVMVNSIRILSEFIDRLPADAAPESTRGRAGFLHPYQIEGGVALSRMRIILRDFETAQLDEFAKQLHQIAEELRARHPRARIEVEIKPQYRNLRDGLQREPRALKNAIQAFKQLNIEPQMTTIRGGTDGSLLTELGLPTPNLSTGQHNPHSPLEWTCLEEMETAVQVLVELARVWGLESS